jgi:addiction module RelE/StbE family toxin
VRPARLLYTPTARDYLRHLHPSLKNALREAIEELALQPLKGKPLQEEFEGFRSHRLKRYRVVYRYDEVKNQIEVLLAASRSDVYRLFSDYLKKLKA